MKKSIRSYFQVRKFNVFGELGIVRLVKYCFILEKNANYRTLLKMSIRRMIFGCTLEIVCGKLKRLSLKITLNRPFYSGVLSCLT